MTTVEPGSSDRQPTSPDKLMDDERLLGALRQGDEAAFEALLDRYHHAMVRLAIAYVGNHAVAEEVAQETWLAVILGLKRFDERASLKTWMFRILVNRARTKAKREGRSLPFSAVAFVGLEPGEPVVDPGRFQPPGDRRWPRHWRSPPQEWDMLPEAWLLSRETCDYLRAAIDSLQPSQRAVVALRDVEGWGADEVCTILGISESNQRVLLHRARSKIRGAMEQYFAEGSGRAR